LAPINLEKYFYELCFWTAQRLAAQLLGRIRFVVTILAGKPKLQLSVRSLSLGQVSCSRVLGLFFYTQYYYQRIYLVSITIFTFGLLLSICLGVRL
jgi:hypothetical protein